MARLLDRLGAALKSVLTLCSGTPSDPPQGQRSEPAQPPAGRPTPQTLNKKSRRPRPPSRSQGPVATPSSIRPIRRGPRPTEVLLTKGQRKSLGRDIRRRAQPARIVTRARIIVELGRDPCVSAAADKLSLDRKTIRGWRERYLAHGRKGLESRPGRGRPVSIDAVSSCQLLAVACGKPADFGLAYRPSWTLDLLIKTYRSEAPDLARLSRGSAWRILNQANLRPHKVKIWLHSPDPAFREKVTDICRCYLAPKPGHIYLCVDEKTGMQALGRKHPTKAASPGRPARFEFEYKRNGTRTLTAAFNPHTGQVFGQVRATRKAGDLIEFMEALAQEYPTDQIHIIWDNLNTHHDGPSKRWEQFNQRHDGRFHFHYTPIHASWVNQVELFFGILHKRLLRYVIYDSVQQLEQAVLGFLQHWNAGEAHPFNWTFKGYPPEPEADVSQAA